MADNKAEAKPKLRSMRPDFATIGGLVVAVGGILGGLILDNGKISDVTQITAAIIVLGGTIGAVMVTSPLSSLFGALGGLKNVFLEEVLDLDAAVETSSPSPPKPARAASFRLKRIWTKSTIHSCARPSPSPSTAPIFRSFTK